MTTINKKELLRWALAEHAFQEADSLAQYIVEAKIESGSHLYAACIAGVASCYCRPFLGAGGLGSLPPEMKNLTQFQGIQHERLLRQVHQMLFDIRNKISTHFDQVFNEQLHQKGAVKDSPSEVIFEISGHGQHTVVVNTTNIDPKILTAVHGLCLLQKERVSRKLAEFGAEILLDNNGRFGRYVFSAATP